MEPIESNAVYTREEFRDLMQISRDKELQLREEGNYPDTIDLGARTTRIRGRDIIAWLDENAGAQPSDTDPNERASA